MLYQKQHYFNVVSSPVQYILQAACVPRRREQIIEFVCYHPWVATWQCVV